MYQSLPPSRYILSSGLIKSRPWSEPRCQKRLPARGVVPLTFGDITHHFLSCPSTLSLYCPRYSTTHEIQPRPPPPRAQTLVSRRRESSRGLDGVLDLLDGALDALLLACIVDQDARDLDDADDTEEEVDCGQKVVLGLDDEAPAGPDEAGGGQGAVLGEGELLGGAGKVGDAGEDEGPLLRQSISPSVYISTAAAGVGGRGEGEGQIKGRTFMTGAQKCTVLTPMGLSHMRLSQLCCACACASAVVLCHLRLHCWRCWRKACCCWRKGEAREKAARVWAAAEAEEKRGREARAKLVVGGMSLSFLPQVFFFFLLFSLDTFRGMGVPVRFG